ncbi:hypothetical protein L0128_16760 [candidate division KSB1 bacterium]|nr:hypothetical protein [candidate division KSB1 bacterium]
MICPLACGRRTPSEPKEIILARIGKKTISLTEFIRRAEYTPRPSYCDRDTYPHKKIVLNSLVAEKLFALEAGEKNPFITSPQIQAWLQGRQEQAMRQYLYEKEGLDRVKLDTTQLKSALVNSAKKYQIAYFNVDDSSQAFQIAKEIRSPAQPLETIFHQHFPLQQIPRRELSWSKLESAAVIDSVFLTRRAKNQILGPLKVAEDQFLFLQILDWQDEIMITDEQVQARWREIKEKIFEKDAKKHYFNFIHTVMRGKSIQFNESTIYQLIELFGPIYLQTPTESQEMSQRLYWDLKAPEISIDKIEPQLKALAHQPFFKINTEVWTVERFIKTLQRHPLVFRKKKLKNAEFGYQFQLAVIDLVRDTCLDQVAYQRGYDRLPSVQREVGMWQDHLNFMYYRANYLKSRVDTSAVKISALATIDQYLNPLVNQLQQKYSPQIEINLTDFEKIKLTHIPMSVIQEGVPFAKMAPGLPQVTTDFRLDYGRKMSAQ